MKDNDPGQVSLGSRIGNVDMANPASLTAFINWAKTNYPAEHYALVIWDHGSGWKSRKASSPARGAVQDETSETFMSLPDLARGVADSGVHFDIINFDACLMGMYEVAYEFRGLTDYMVFSEETEPGEGDPYDSILGALTGNPLMSASGLASAIVSTYDAFYTINDKGETTKSAVDMSKLDILDAKLLALITALSNDGAAAAAVAAARSGTQEYTYPSNHDLWSFSDYLETSIAGAAVKAAAAEVKTAVSSMVVANASNGTGVAASHGLAIYLPLDSETNAGELAEYALLACNKTARASATGTWGSYLETLLSGVSGGTAQYEQGGFGVYVTWTNAAGQACDADLDLYVWEPASDFASTGSGDVYAPFMGQTSPNGFFSADSVDSQISEEYYLANDQVLAGDYYFLVNYWADGTDCTQATTHLFIYDPLYYSDTNWHEVGAPVGLDLSYPWTNQAITTLADLNAYSDWWVPFMLTRTAAGPVLSQEASLPVFTKHSQLLLRYKKGSRLFGAFQ